MTTRDLVAALTIAEELEGRARTHYQALAADDLAERDMAVRLMRQAIGLRTVMTQWIAARACRAEYTTR